MSASPIVRVVFQRIAAMAWSQVFPPHCFSSAGKDSQKELFTTWSLSNLNSSLNKFLWKHEKKCRNVEGCSFTNRVTWRMFCFTHVWVVVGVISRVYVVTEARSMIDSTHEEKGSLVFERAREIWAYLIELSAATGHVHPGSSERDLRTCYEIIWDVNDFRQRVPASGSCWECLIKVHEWLLRFCFNRQGRIEMT